MVEGGWQPLGSVARLLEVGRPFAMEGEGRRRRPPL